MEISRIPLLRRYVAFPQKHIALGRRIALEWRFEKAKEYALKSVE